jgi:nodulation protein E
MMRDAPHRVVVTGVGTVSALGNNADEFWHALQDGRCGVGPATKVSGEQLQTGVTAEVRDFDACRHFDKRHLAQLDPFAQFALVSAAEAIMGAGLANPDALGADTAIIMGSAFGGDTAVNDAACRVYGGHNERVHPMTIPRAMTNAAVSHIAIEHGITGPAFAVSSACASAAHAIGQAAWMVRQGIVSSAITGGSESCLTRGTLKAWEAMRVLAPDTCRPFSRDRKGIVLGEGAGILVLESLDAARSRGAEIVAELAGFGMSTDAQDIVQPSCEGAARAITACLRDAGLTGEEIDYVNAHGTGTKLNDVVETCALRRVFNGHAARLSVSSTKSMHGHAMGAAGALEAVATVLAIRHGVIPPTVNYSEPDPECDMDYTPNAARDFPIRTAISNSFAFGGLNAVLAMTQFS